MKTSELGTGEGDGKGERERRGGVSFLPFLHPHPPDPHHSYDAYLSRHGGMSNAYTELEATVYYFDVKPASLVPALDRFAQFFTSPLVKADALEREVCAVDNEFAGVKQSDSCRLGQMRCDTCAPGHPFRRFFWGNRASLYDRPRAAGADVRASVVDFYRGHYAADRMSLVVLGGHTLDELEAEVTPRFGAVPGGRGPPPAFSAAGPPYTGASLHILPSVKDGHVLHVSWCLPPLAGRYRAKAEDYVAHLVGHEGAGSLLTALKARGWASSLCAGVGDGGVDRSSAAYVFDVAVTLTDAGLAAGVEVEGEGGDDNATTTPPLPGSGLAVASLIFQYVAMLAAAGPQPWVHAECAAVAAARFRFAEEEDAADYTARLAHTMPHYAPEHALSGPFLHDEWDEGLVEGLVARMAPASARLDLRTSSAGAALDAWVAALPGAVKATEPWFGFDYVAAPVPAGVVAAWEAACAPSARPADLALPPPNPFIPTDFTLRCDDEGGDECSPQNGGAGAAKRARSSVPPPHTPADAPLCPPPSLLINETGLRVWHKQDTHFRVPRAAAYFSVAPLDAHATPAAAAVQHTLMRLWDDALCATAYLADVAGLAVDGWPEGSAGVEVRVDGFSHKLPALADAAFTALASPSFTDASFARVRETLAREYRNAHVSPDRHAAWLRLAALKKAWPPAAVLAALEAMAPASLRAAAPAALANCCVEALVQGNVSAAGAVSLARGARAALPGPPSPPPPAPTMPSRPYLRDPPPCCSPPPSMGTK